MNEKNLSNDRKHTLLSLFLIFLKIGAFTWGGGYVMLPLIRHEVVEKKKWITLEDFINGIAVSQSVPGAIAINTATFVGNKVSGVPGALVAALGATLPSFVAITLVSMFFLSFRQLTMVQNFFKGATPAIVALLASALISIARDALKEVKEIIFAALLLFLLIYFNLNPIFAIVIAALFGLFLRRRQ
jgi:chromate transporter